MEEMEKKLRTLEKLLYDFDFICALLCILKDAIWQNEDQLNVHYSQASFYISEELDKLGDKLSALLDDLFDALKEIKESI